MRGVARYEVLSHCVVQRLVEHHVDVSNRLGCQDRGRDGGDQRRDRHLDEMGTAARVSTTIKGDRPVGYGVRGAAI